MADLGRHATNHGRGRADATATPLTPSPPPVDGTPPPPPPVAPEPPAAERPKRKRRSLPLLEGVLPIDRTRVPIDVVAGVTLAALAIPEVMGYTQIAGMPVITGLYTILIPLMAFAIIGSSRHLVVGADS